MVLAGYPLVGHSRSASILAPAAVLRTQPRFLAGSASRSRTIATGRSKGPGFRGGKR